jgi:hypothetical protein
MAWQLPDHGRKRRALPGGLRVLAGAAALALAGCTTSLGLQQDGTYILESGEAGMDCQRLSNGISAALQVLKSLPDAARFERAQAAPTAVAAFGRLFGSDGGLVAIAKYDRERAHALALHRVSMDKGCSPFDIERELAAADAAMSEFRKP